MFCDNEAVVRNSTLPETTLKKEQVDVCFHRVRGACASGMIQIAKEDGAITVADLLTMSLQSLITRFN